INVNAVCPACVKTDMMFENQALYHVFRPDLEAPTTADIEATIEEALHKLPEPWIEPEEVSDIVVFLASERGRHITGTGIDITMGASAGWGAGGDGGGGRGREGGRRGRPGPDRGPRRRPA